MSQYQISKDDIINATGLISYVTIVGRLIPVNDRDYMKLVRLAYGFRKAVICATRMISKELPTNTILKELRAMLNKAYGDSAYKVAKALVEGAKFNDGNPRHIKIKRLFIISEGEASRFGNRNIRLENTGAVRVKYPYDGTWLTFRALFGAKHIPLVKELVKLARNKNVSYAARIIFHNGKAYLHLSIPIQLYLKHFSKGKAVGDLIAGFDLNSDRINMVIIDRYGRIRDIKTERFPEVTSHGYPRNKARTKRLEAIAKLLKYAYHHNVGTVIFENLLTIKKKRYVRNPTANRKITKFAKKKLLQHGIVMAMKYEFRTLLINPKGTTHSKEHNYIMRKYGLDRHTASAYLIALKGIKRHTMIQKAMI